MGGTANNVFTIPQGTTLHDGAPYSHSVLMTNPNSTYTVRDVEAGQIAHFYAAVSFASQAAQTDMRLQNANATSDYQLQLISTPHAGYNAVPVEWSMTKTTTAGTDLSNLSFAWDNLLETAQIPVKRLFVFDTDTNAWVQLPEGNTSVDEFNNTLIYNGFVGELNNTRFMIAQGESELTLTADFDNLTRCDGTSSGLQSFSVAGKNLTNPVTVTAPTNFEISLIPQGPFSDEITVNPIANNLTTTVVYIRIAADATATGTFDINATSPDAFYTVISTTTPITSVPDPIAPTITAPIAFTASTTTACTVAIANLGTVITNDNCGVPTVTNDAPTNFPVGTTTVTWTVTDASGNTATDTQTVVVTDVTAPTITAPEDITVSANANCAVSGVALGTPVTDDNCTVANLSNNAPTAFPMGTTTVIWTVTDAAGIATTAVQEVTVIDDSAPIVTAPAAVEIRANNSCNALNVPLGTPVSSDNCSIASTTHNAPQAFPIGNTTVLWTVTDTAGNSTTVSQTVTVIDTIAPQAITRDLTVLLDATGNASITANMVNNASADNCVIAGMSIDISSFDCTNVGANVVTLTVTDESGNTSQNTAIVTVIDTVKPVVITQDITRSLDASGRLTITAAEIDNGSTDSCDYSIALSKTNFNCNDIGLNTLLLTITDASGNTNTASAELIILDETVPIANVQDITIGLDAQGNASITADDVDAGSFDTCSTISKRLDKAIFACTDEGINLVVFTITDTSGNTTSTTVTVTVENNAPDSNGDGLKDNCGGDDDNDGDDDDDDNCPFDSNPDQLDTDLDGIGDMCDDDDDNDGILDTLDNCPLTYNPRQDDVNRNGIGDVCDNTDLDISEALTPNGDGINDTWEINNIQKHPNNSVAVYNRSGALVFFARSYQNTWDGHHNDRSKSLPSGSYYYQIDLDGNGSIEKKGWLYINR